MVREVSTADRPDRIDYNPVLDGDADPGEIVWAWVPFEENPTRGKDRPLLVVGRSGRGLRALMLTSNAPDEWERDDHHELGEGGWDGRGRVSYVRLDRLFALDAEDIRREGAILDPVRFGRLAAALRDRYGWG